MSSTAIAISDETLALAIVKTTMEGKSLLYEVRRCFEELGDATTTEVRIHGYQSAARVIAAINEIEGFTATMPRNYAGPQFLNNLACFVTVSRTK